MSFLDNLREYLQGLSQGSGHPEAVPTPPIDASTARTQLIQVLERVEQREQQIPRADSAFPVLRAADLLREWQQNDYVVRFARRLDQLLRQSIGKDASPKEREDWIAIALARQFGLPDELTSRIRTLEIDRLAGIVRMDLLASSTFSYAPDIEAYSTAIRATRGVPPHVSITPIGRVFLELTGRDAIRWLLQIEAAQSTGPADPWRVSRETARTLKTQRLVSSWLDNSPDFPDSWATLRRLEELGLVSIEEDERARQSYIEASPMGRTLLAEIEQETESPMSVLANSLLADLTLSAANSVTKPDKRAADPHASTAAEATARQARLVAHEIRNVLVPAKTALSALYREVLLEAPSEVLHRRRESIDRGIDATFRFVDQLVSLSTLAATPPEPFDPLPAIREAVSAVESETGRRIQQQLPTSLPPVTGHRARVVLAIANVLRNAAQAVNAQDAVIHLQAESIESARAVLLTIEDNGPGVPENMRRAIFTEGVSLRPGGAGLGLALVREVIENELRGLVACDASPLGGARFVLRMPATGMERP
ncbi:MAG TPA: ATP-binding protein [Myxococcaceae bacterium]|jgi:signal transduction histidine kinase